MNKRYKSGFTIIEISIAGFLIVILGVAILGLQRVIGDSQLFGFTNYINVDEANSAVSVMAREMRTMRSGQNGAYPIVTGNDDDLSFYSDIDKDGVSELVRYWISSQTLFKSVTEPSGFPAVYDPGDTQTYTITTNVNNGADSLFLYFNDNWPEDTTNNPLPTPADLAEVRLIRISLNVSSNENVSSRGYSLGTNVNLRMLKDNL
jgi:type II secretory pathway pseudopilin PulG